MTVSPTARQDGRGHFHIVSHNQNTNNVCGSKAAGASCGAHLFSRDSYTWAVGKHPVYDADVTLTNGSKATFQTRQRPQLLLNPATLAPEFLFNGGGFDGANADCTHLTHTFVQAFAGHRGDTATEK